MNSFELQQETTLTSTPLSKYSNILLESVSEFVVFHMVTLGHLGQFSQVILVVVLLLRGKFFHKCNCNVFVAIIDQLQVHVYKNRVQYSTKFVLEKIASKELLKIQLDVYYILPYKYRGHFLQIF